MRAGIRQYAPSGAEWQAGAGSRAVGAVVLRVVERRLWYVRVVVWLG